MELHQLVGDQPWGETQFYELLRIAVYGEPRNQWYGANLAHVMVRNRIYADRKREVAISDSRFIGALEDGYGVFLDQGDLEQAYTCAIGLSEQSEPNNHFLLAVGPELYRLNMAKARERLQSGKSKADEKAWRALEVAWDMKQCGDFEAEDRIVAAATLIAEANARYGSFYQYGSGQLLKTLLRAGLDRKDAIALIAQPQIAVYQQCMSGEDDPRHVYAEALHRAEILMKLHYRGGTRMGREAAELGYRQAVGDNDFYGAERFLEFLERTGCDVQERWIALLEQQITHHIDRAMDNPALQGEWVSWEKRPYVCWFWAATASAKLQQFDTAQKTLTSELLRHANALLPFSEEDYKWFLGALPHFGVETDPGVGTELVMASYWRAIDSLQELAASTDTREWEVDEAASCGLACCSVLAEYSNLDIVPMLNLIAELALPVFGRVEDVPEEVEGVTYFGIHTTSTQEFLRQYKDLATSRDGI